MRVLHISTQKNWGGGEQQLVYLIDFLQQQKTRQSIICPDVSALKSNLSLNSNIKLEPVYNLSPLGWLLALLKIFREEKPSIVHAHDSKAHSFCVLASMLSFSRWNIVVHRRVALGETKSWFSKLKYNHKNIKKIICISNFVYSNLEKFIKDKNLLITIHSGINLKKSEAKLKKDDPFLELPIPVDANLILSIGSLTEQKRQSFFIDIAADIIKNSSSDNYLFFIVGEGPCCDQLSLKIKDLGIEDRVKMVGFTRQVPSLMKRANVLVLTAEKEAFGNIIMEAFAAKLPVVAANSGGVVDLIKHNKTGLLAPLGSIKDFSESIVKFIEDSAYTKEIICEAYEFVKKVDFENIGQEICRVYNEVETKQEREIK